MAREPKAYIYEGERYGEWKPLLSLIPPPERPSIRNVEPLYPRATFEEASAIVAEYWADKREDFATLQRVPSEVKYEELKTASEYPFRELATKVSVTEQQVALKVSRFRPMYRALSDDEKTLHDAIKDKAAELETLFERVGGGRYASLALTDLEKSVMWAVKQLTS